MNWLILKMLTLTENSHSLVTCTFRASPAEAFLDRCSFSEGGSGGGSFMVISTTCVIHGH